MTSPAEGRVPGPAHSGRHQINSADVGWFPSSFRHHGTKSVVSHCPSMDKPKDKTDRREKPEKMPAAGPHAKPELTDPDKTPGAGTLPPAGKEQDDGSNA